MHSFMYDFSFGSLVIASEMACTRRDSHVGASAAVADAASARHTSNGTALMQARSQPPASRAEARPESDNISCLIILMCWRCAAGGRRNDQRNTIRAGRASFIYTVIRQQHTRRSAAGIADECPMRHGHWTRHTTGIRWRRSTSASNAKRRSW